MGAIAAVELCLNLNIKRLSNSSLDVTTSMSSLRAYIHQPRARTKKSIRHVSVNSQCPARHLISEHRNSQFFLHRALPLSFSFFVSDVPCARLPRMCRMCGGCPTVFSDMCHSTLISGRSLTSWPTTTTGMTNGSCNLAELESS